MLGGGGDSETGMLQMMMNAGTNVAGEALWGGANPIASGATYLLKSKKLNIAAAIHAAKSDSRTKVLASPCLQ